MATLAQLLADRVPAGEPIDAAGRIEPPETESHYAASLTAIVRAITLSPAWRAICTAAYRPHADWVAAMAADSWTPEELGDAADRVRIGDAFPEPEGWSLSDVLLEDGLRPGRPELLPYCRVVGGESQEEDRDELLSAGTRWLLVSIPLDARAYTPEDTVHPDQDAAAQTDAADRIGLLSEQLAAPTPEMFAAGGAICPTRVRIDSAGIPESEDGRPERFEARISIDFQAS